jgi:hypothetical protein
MNNLRITKEIPILFISLYFPSKQKYHNLNSKINQSNFHQAIQSFQLGRNISNLWTSVLDGLQSVLEILGFNVTMLKPTQEKEIHSYESQELV